jgi:hypothetical protein
MYDGVVTVAGDDIPVIVVFEGDNVRLSTSGAEIGEWPMNEFGISHVGDTTFELTADSETLRFVPNQPSLFAAEVNGGLVDLSSDDAERPKAVAVTEDVPGSKAILDAPPPKAFTMAMFYGLCALTAGLGLWSLASIILG